MCYGGGGGNVRSMSHGGRATGRSGEAALSRLGVTWGFAALVTMLTAFTSSSWIYTREPVTLPNSDIPTSIHFKIGLWRICPTVKRPANHTIHMPSPACSLVSYSGWEDVRHSDLGVWTPLEFAPSFITKMRTSTLFEGTSLGLILLGVLFALIGHCNGDHKTLIACGLYILGGLSLGSGLVVFATAVSETYIEATADRRLQLTSAISNGGNRYHSGSVIAGPYAAASTGSGEGSNSGQNSLYDYRYGWSFFAAIAAFIMSEMAALFSITAYLRRFPTVEDMVREMVPGAERKLREHQHLSSEYLVRHSGPLPGPCKQREACRVAQPHVQLPRYQERIPEAQPLAQPHLSQVPPDLCTSNEAKAKTLPREPTTTTSKAINSRGGISVMMEQEFPQTPLAGQTIPITIKRTRPAPSGGYPRYGTLPGNRAHQVPSQSISQHATIQRGSSATLQHPPKKKTVTIGTFQTMDTSSGSAV